MRRATTLAAATALLCGVCTCSDGANPPAGCDPAQSSSCGGATAYCGPDRACQTCPAGTYNCDGLNTNACESPTTCGAVACVSQQTASSCGTTRYCVAQQCAACAAGKLNCDLNDANGCESTTACGAASCVPNNAGASSCGTSQYCAGKTCAACPTGSFSCDRNDSNMCESTTACGATSCVPNNAGASGCGPTQYCAGKTCAVCAAGSFNCDLNDNNMCESATSCGLTGHVRQGCNGTVYQVDITEGASVCSGVTALKVQVTVGDTLGLPPAAGRTYTIKSPAQVDIYPADGEATAVSLGAVLGNAQSGTFTLGPASPAGTRDGTYQLTLEGGVQVSGSFRADLCPFDPTAC